jgi:NAD(P)-dependent dehydrogenase (short-subunit alcohol dehydrogenase family)
MAVGRFDGMNALVTGGARGIGGATAALLAGEGARVVVADVLDDEGRAHAEAIGATYLHLDVADAEAWREVGAGPRLDLAVLNAGIGARFEDLLEVSDDLITSVIATNATSLLVATRELARCMAGEGGSISVTASIAGLVAHTQSPIYGASKWAAIGWVRSIAPWLEPRGVRINAVCPGLVDTPVLGPGGGDRMRAMGFAVLDPAEVASAHADVLCAPTTGTAYTVQAGRPLTAFEFAPVPGYQG